jgi:hypothetical protein
LILSRPFSYNDENFTIIGNVLFFHVLSTGALAGNKNLLKFHQRFLEEWFQESALHLCRMMLLIMPIPLLILLCSKIWL